MSDAVDISVIIPAYNRQAVIGRALASVLAQEAGGLEILVIDDGSTDATAAVAAGFPQVTVIRRANGGPAAARNAGIRQARGRWIAFLDSDDAWRPGKLRAQMALLSATPGAAFCATAHRTFTPDGRCAARPAAMPVDAVDMQRQILDNIAVQTDSVIVARDLLETLGGFDERLHTAEDVELFLRCAAATRPVFLEEVFVDVYLGDDGTVRRYGRIARAACRREVFLRCGRHLVDRRLRHDRRRALAREALELARLHLADGARAEAARWLIRSVGGGLDADRLKVALECLLGTERYDRHSARAKGVARLWR